MCGRTAQSQGAVYAASTSLKSNSHFQGNLADRIGPRASSNNGNDRTFNKETTGSGPTNGEEKQTPTSESDGSFPWRDNFNMSPGHDAVVFTMNQQEELQMDRKIWGLVTKAGTSKSPVPRGPSKHFANMMFNARSDTLFSKPTFSRLLNEGKTCLVAFDGFFEWKADALGGGKGKKQPYFVFPKNSDDTNGELSNRPYLLLAGLWTSVNTGYSSPEPTALDTFTLLTTEVCDPLKWLHSRMPVCVWDEDLAMKWLKQPTQKCLDQLDRASNKTQKDFLQWHAVSTQMSSTKYRSPDAIKAISKPKSVKSFFAPVGKSNKVGASKTGKNSKLNSTSKQIPTITSPMTGTKRSVSAAKTSPSVKTPPNKKTKTSSPPVAKKSSITSFFSPKNPKS